MQQEEIVQLFDRFINEQGLFYSFKEWIEAQGYSLSELGMSED